MNERYRDAGNKGRKEINLEPDDLVWLHLWKDRFPDLRKSKLMPRADDLKPYLGEDELELRTTPLQEGEDDEDISPMLTSDTPSVVMHGPLTRARARQLNQQERNMKAMRTSKGEESKGGRPSQVGGPIHLGVGPLGLQEQSAPKSLPRPQTGSIFSDPHMPGKIKT
ncbi:hypothetical protein U9M48_042809 [Paspalum notatum var. saurae]|uniref:Uncharacterized protein n=1 Tax=Paspalum notatum var. saurae TaxID=547442 RepID=A0AAQ3URX2_PASNO